MSSMSSGEVYAYAYIVQGGYPMNEHIARTEKQLGATDAGAFVKGA